MENGGVINTKEKLFFKVKKNMELKKDDIAI